MRVGEYSPKYQRTQPLPRPEGNLKPLFLCPYLAQFQDGSLFLQLLNSVAPGSVDTRKLNSQTTSVFLKVEQCNHVVDVAAKLGMRIVGFGGKDIVDGKRRFILALTHQIWRYYVLQRFRKVL